jgi:hypothetical protein
MEVSRDAGITRGLNGAVQRLIVNGHTWQNLAERANAEHQRGISRYDGPPCPISTDANPCLNGGVCQPMLAMYVCKCPLKYSGNHCENRKYTNTRLDVMFKACVVRQPFCTILQL